MAATIDAVTSTGYHNYGLETGNSIKFTNDEQTVHTITTSEFTETLQPTESFTWEFPHDDYIVFTDDFSSRSGTVHVADPFPLINITSQPFGSDLQVNLDGTNLRLFESFSVEVVSSSGTQIHQSARSANSTGHTDTSSFIITEDGDYFINYKPINDFIHRSFTVVNDEITITGFDERVVVVSSSSTTNGLTQDQKDSLIAFENSHIANFTSFLDTIP